ncbi:hypothetical protein D9M73_106430 [compost metagenome]
MQHEIGRGHGEQNAGHTADDEGEHERDGPHHRQLITDAAVIHGEQPVEDLRARRDRDDHRGDREERVDAGARAHGEEVVQPDEIGEDRDDDRRIDHRGIAEQALAGEGRHHFREHAESGQDEDVHLRVAPDPDEVDVHHRVAAQAVREELHADIAVERQQSEHGGQHREGGDDQGVGAQRGPHEHRHLHQRHARRAHLDDGRDQVDARQQRADTGNLQAPDIIIDPHVRAGGNARQRRHGEPAGARIIADEQRDHGDHRARRRHPEAEIVEIGEGHVARADLQRHDEVHQARDQRHRHEEDHDHAVRGEDLVVMVGRQVTGVAVKGHRLLRAHHQRVGEAAHEHHQSEDDVHDADLLVVDAGEPVAPQHAPCLEIGDDREQRDSANSDAGKGDEHGQFVQRQRIKRETAEDRADRRGRKREGGRHVRKSFGRRRSPGRLLRGCRASAFQHR